MSEVPFEKQLEELQTLVKRMESGQLSLDESLKQFEAGVKLVKSCQEYLATAEKKVEILIQGEKKPYE